MHISKWKTIKLEYVAKCDSLYNKFRMQNDIDLLINIFIITSH